MDTETHRLKRVFILCAILLLGFVLRSFQLNFPSIGYHNMQENEYLSMAQEMQRTNDFIHKRIYFYNAFEENPSLKESGQPPLVSYQILLSWKLLGENLWGPRLFNVVFGVSSILVIYFISLSLFGNITISLFCSLLLAIMPLGVFFSRNLQPESPAFFFMLLGNLFYLRFTSSFKKYNLFLGGVLFSVAWLYKSSFLIGILPFVFCFPFKALCKEKKEFLKYVLTFLLPYVVIIIAILNLKQVGQWQFQTVKILRLFDIFSLSYWKLYGNAIWWFTKGENYTLMFTLLALLGIILTFLKGNGLLNRYIIGWSFSAVFYAVVSSEEMHQQNYFQMPFLAMVCVSCAYTISFISETVKKFLKKDLLIYLMAAVALISIPFVYGSISRMYSTIFLGEDVAGGTIRDLTSADERIFLLTHAQGYGIARYAQRYVGWFNNLEEFKEKENKFKIRYLCIYPAQYLELLAKNSGELFAYIQSNYHVKEAGVLEEPNQLVYFIFEKGKGQNLQGLQSFSGQLQLKTIYKLFGRLIFFYTMSPVIEKN